MSDIGLDPSIAREYERWLEKIGPEDPYAGPDTLGIHDVLRAHFLIADFFYKEGEGIGGLGPRDLELLHSATYRQHITLGGKPKWRDKYELCATLMYGLIKDHPFHDANKRTAFLSTLYFLFKQNRVPTIPAKEFEDFTVLVADNGLSKFSRYKELTKKKDDPEVLYMAHYIKSNTRQVDRRYYVVTYRELDSLLRVCLENRFRLVVSCDSSSGCGQNRAVAGWPRSPRRRSATRLI